MAQSKSRTQLRIGGQTLKTLFTDLIELKLGYLEKQWGFLYSSF